MTSVIDKDLERFIELLTMDGWPNDIPQEYEQLKERINERLNTS